MAQTLTSQKAQLQTAHLSPPPAQQTNVLTLQSGERSDIVVGNAGTDELYCFSGSARIVSQAMGVGWFMRAGEGCVLRAATRYHVFAHTKLRMSVERKRIPFTLNHTNKLDKGIETGKTKPNQETKADDR